jgi:hypothetical protein
MSLRLASDHMTGREALRLILDYAEGCDEREVPGIVAAVSCLLHADEVSAAAVVDAVRHPQYRGECTVRYHGRPARARRVERLPNGLYRADFTCGLWATYADDPVTNPAAKQTGG